MTPVSIHLTRAQKWLTLALVIAVLVVVSAAKIGAHDRHASQRTIHCLNTGRGCP